MPRLLICNEAIAAGGIGTFTLSVVKTFIQRGWDVGFVVTNGPGEYFDEIVALVQRYYDFSDQPLGYKKFKMLLKAVEEFGPDILLLNHCSLAHYTLPFLDKSIKPVAVLHNDVALFYQRAVLFRSRIFRWIVPSQKLKETLKQYLPQHLHGRICTIPHGIDVTEFAFKTRQAVRRRIVFVGNLGENKGADLLPRIFEGIRSRLPDVEFHIVGEGTLKEPLKGECASLSLSVQFLGGVLPDKVPSIFQNADILLLPSRVEGFGLVIAEAMACGTVPVVSRLRGITDDIVADGITGFLVAPEDSKGFVRSIVSLLEDTEMLRRMAVAAAATAREQFSLDKMARSYEDLFLGEDVRRCRARIGFIAWSVETARELLTREPDGSVPLLRLFCNFGRRLMHKT